MKRSITLIISVMTGLLALNTMQAQVAAVKFIVKVPATDHAYDLKVHLAGSFNSWNPNDSFYVMHDEGNGYYSLLVPLFANKIYAYKYTLGSWNTVETLADDSERNNRSVFSKDQVSIYDTVARWKTPPAPTKPSLQMRRLMAMKDSATAGLQATLNKLMIVLKAYNEIMLSPNPSERAHKKLVKKTIRIISDFYVAIDTKVWQTGISLKPEQKQQILEAIHNADPSANIVTVLGNAYTKALQ